MVFAAAALVAAAGCATNADLQQTENQQSQLRGMIAKEQQQGNALRQQVRRLQDEIDEIQHGGAGGAAPGDRIAALDERLNKLEAAVSALQAGASAAAGAPGTPPAAVASVAPGAGTVAPGEAGAPSGAPAAWQVDLDKELSSPVSGPGAKVYREGLQAMKDNQYALAGSKFALIQRKYPKSDLVEPAQYFSASALFESGKYDQSILQFNDLVMRYPKGRFAATALLREAQAFLKLNDKIDARLTLQKLISDHGDTAEASAANAMMKDLED